MLHRSAFPADCRCSDGANSGGRPATEGAGEEIGLRASSSQEPKPAKPGSVMRCISSAIIVVSTGTIRQGPQRKERRDAPASKII